MRRSTAILVAIISAIGTCAVVAQPNGEGRPPSTRVGRYELEVHAMNGLPGAFIIDTESGHVWAKREHGRWTDWGSPAAAGEQKQEAQQAR